MVKTRHAMKSLRPQQAGFYGQALLIAAPLLILSAVALYSLRLDRSAIDQDARDRAQALVPELAQHLGQNLSREMRNLPDKLPQGLLVDGQILFPIDYPRLPTPPDWPAQLKPEQRELLRSAEEAIFRKRDPNAARNALAAVKAAGLPEPASAHLELSLLLLESRYVSVPHLGERLTDLAHRYPKAYTETGTPIADLALIQALRFTPAGPLPDALETELSERVRSYPSFLVPELLERRHEFTGTFSCCNKTGGSQIKGRAICCALFCSIRFKGMDPAKSGLRSWGKNTLPFTVRVLTLKPVSSTFFLSLPDKSKSCFCQHFPPERAESRPLRQSIFSWEAGTGLLSAAHRRRIPIKLPLKSWRPLPQRCQSSPAWHCRCRVFETI
jgi:hypothetical protein